MVYQPKIRKKRTENFNFLIVINKLIIAFVSNNAKNIIIDFNNIFFGIVMFFKVYKRYKK